MNLRFGEGLYFSSVSGKANDYAFASEKVCARCFHSITHPFSWTKEVRGMSGRKNRGTMGPGEIKIEEIMKPLPDFLQHTSRLVQQIGAQQLVLHRMKGGDLTSRWQAPLFSWCTYLRELQ